MSTFGEDLIQSLNEALDHAKGEGPAIVHAPVSPREVRMEAKLTQIQMAALMGMSLSGYRKWEQGRRRVSGPALALLRIIKHDPNAVRHARARATATNMTISSVFESGKDEQLVLEETAAQIHEKLWDEWSGLKLAVDSYSDLFLEQEDREILDPFGGETFYYWIWPALWRDLVLRLTRLTDPAGKGKTANISVARLLKFCGDDAELRTEINAALDLAQQATASSRAFRNKRIAHADEQETLSNANIGPKNLDEIKVATQAIYNVLYKFDLRKLQRHVADDVVHHHPAGFFIRNLATASDAVRWIAELLTDPEDPERFNHEELGRVMERLGREYDQQVDMRRLMDLWKLGKRLPPSRPTHN